jgi:type II secretory pathway component GspD/PulD (secretin)
MMRRALFGAALCLAMGWCAASPSPAPPPPRPVTPAAKRAVDVGQSVKVDFTGISVSQAVAVVYGEILNQPYVIDPAVLKDDRAVSFRFDAANGDLKRFWRDFMDSLGIEVTVRSGVDYVALKWVDEAKKDQAERQPFIYRTKYRPTAYLVEMLSPLFPDGGFALNRTVRAPTGSKVDIGAGVPAKAPTGSAASLIDQDSNTLIFQGTTNEIATLERLLAQVDVPTGEVIIKAVVYEATTGRSDGTAFSLAASIIGGKLGVSIGSAVQLGNALTFHGAGIDAAISALAADSRFKSISTPRVRVKSGQQAHLVVGEDVPTLGAVTVPQAGTQPVQSVEYRSFGVILDLRPTVRDEAVEVLVDQQISGFARTETGVNNSPTLTKRALSTTVTAADGELIVLGGLTQDKRTEAHSGLFFLPKFMHTHSSDDGRSEILLLLQVSKI